MTKWIGALGFVAALALATVALAALSHAAAQEKRRFGKSLVTLFHYTPIDGGIVDGIKLVALSEVPAQLAALKTWQTDAFTADIATAYRLEETDEGRILVKFGDAIPNYVNTVIYAANDLAAKHPEELRRFLAAWFEAVAFMKQNKAETVRIVSGVLKMPESIVGRVYDETARMITGDGRFDRKGLAALARSFVEMNMLPAEPDMSKLYTEEFLPVISR